jgi:Tol biopolymer transport system component
MRSSRITSLIGFLILALTFQNWSGASLARAEGQLTPTPNPIPKGRIAYFSPQTDKKTSVLNVVDADGSNPTIYQAGCSNWPGSWSPDGRMYAFFEDDNTEPCSGELLKVHILNATDKFVRTLENTHSLFPSPLFWSFDSQQLAFVAGLEGGEQLFVVKPDGSGLRQLTNDRLNKQAFIAAWSPDGKQLAYVAASESGTVFYTIKSDGTDPHQLTNPIVRGSPDSDFFWLDNQRIIGSLGISGVAPTYRQYPQANKR